MRITFHGAVRTVTGSRHLIDVNGSRILLDCGLYQGRRQESFARNRTLPFDCASVDVLILSHAHIDHSGNIPNLVRNGFNGDIISTYATRDLAAIMLRDSARILQSDVEYMNRRRERNGQIPVEPYYEMADAIASMRLFLSMGYERTREIAPGVSLTFYDAGHMLGSAIVALDIADEDTGRDVRLVFSGDLGRDHRPILRDPTRLDRADILLLESTYGDRDHEPDMMADELLRDIINRTTRRGGKVIVPAFSVGRTQELVYRIHRLVERNEISDDLPIYVDSPLAIDATAVFRMHPEAYDEEIEQFMLEDKHGDPFGFDMMMYTRAVSQSKALNHLEEPAVIISASGMAENGRILHHLKNNIEDARNTLLMVGWTAPNTLGRRLVEKQPRVRIFGDEYHLNAEVQMIPGFSGHADRGELLEWVGALQSKPEQIFLVHGDEAASLAFADSLRQRGHQQVTVPEMGAAFDV